MDNAHSSPHGSTDQSRKFHQTVMDDIRYGDLKRSFLQDIKDIYSFYFDSHTKKRLRSMKKWKRAFFIGFWFVKSLILKLNPLRRILLLVSFLLFFIRVDSSGRNGINVIVDTEFIAYALLLLVLALELMDKLLARNELAVGRAVQNALMPEKKPNVPGWDIWIFNRPANEVGGDLVDFIKIDDNRFGVAVGDVAGKGLGAALFMAKLQATLRALIPHFAALDKLGLRMNEIFFKDGLPDRFASLMYLELKPTTGKIRILNAGHIPPYLQTANGIKEIEHGSPALGIKEKVAFKEQHLELALGNMLFIYSDGLTEAQNEEGDFFGDQRLKGLIFQHRNLSSEKIGTHILSAIDNFIKDSRPTDDLSMIILKCKK